MFHSVPTSPRTPYLAGLQLLFMLHGAAATADRAYAQAALTPSAQPSAAGPQPSAAGPQDIEAVIASPEYKELIREGMLKYTRGFWPEARAYFQKAHELAPNARTLRGLALVCFDSHHYVEASDYAEQALAHRVQPLSETMVEQLKQLQQQAQGLVARVELATQPATVELRVDGTLTAVRADGRVWLDAGTHDLTLAAPGFTTETRRVQLSESSQTRLDIELAPRSAPQPTALAATQPQTARTESGSALPWILVGVSTALAAVGGILIATDHSDGPTGKTPAGVVLLGVGGVGVVAGLTWSLWPRSEPERAAAAQLRMGPTSVQLHGSF